MALKLTKSSVIQFRTRDRVADEEETPVGLAPALSSSFVPMPPTMSVDLSGKPKIWFVIGPGRSGKTMLLRWAAETSIGRGAAPIVVAADPQNRSLKNYMEVHEPPTNDADATSRWLESLLRHIMGPDKASALIDLGGGDTALHKLLTGVPTLATDLDAEGVAPVAVYTLGTRVDDLAALASFEALGFHPQATVLVRNQGLADPTVDRDDAFARVMRHSAYRKAVDAGAVEVWMPSLNPDELAEEIEAKRIGFIQARDAISPAGRKVTPLAPFDRSRVRNWLDIMALEMTPISSWLP